MFKWLQRHLIRVSVCVGRRPHYYYYYYYNKVTLSVFSCCFLSFFNSSLSSLTSSSCVSNHDSSFLLDTPTKTFNTSRDNLKAEAYKVHQQQIKIKSNALILTMSLCSFTFIARSSYASAVLGIVILSVRPAVCLSVRHTRAL